MNLQQKRNLMDLKRVDEFVYTMMMIDTNDRTIPTVQTPPWVTDLGHELKRLVDNGTIQRMWFDSNGTIQVHPKPFP